MLYCSCKNYLLTGGPLEVRGMRKGLVRRRKRGKIRREKEKNFNKVF